MASHHHKAERWVKVLGWFVIVGLTLTAYGLSWLLVI